MHVESLLNKFALCKADALFGRYVVSYSFWGLLLFSLFYFESWSPLFLVSELQTDLTTFLTAYTLKVITLPVDIEMSMLLFDNGIKLEILHTCNAMAPFLLYLAAIIAYPTFIKEKLKAIVLGYIIIVVLNSLRILLIMYEVALSPDNLTWTHDYVGRYGMGAMTLILFWIFTEKVSIKRAPNHV